MPSSRDIKEIVLRINDEAARKKLTELKDRIDNATKAKQRLQAKNKAGNWTDDDRRALMAYTKEINQCQRSMDRMRATGESVERTLRDLSAASPRELQRTLRELNRQMESGNIRRGSEDWDRYTEAVRRTRGELQRIRDEQREQLSLTRQLSGAAGLGGLVYMADRAVAAFTSARDAVDRYVEAYARMDEAESQVVKYTGMDKEEVRALNEDLKKMDTRTPREQLNALAGDAGRLGITAREDILDFVDAADKINVALGEDLGEDAVKQIGKLALMFGENDRLGLRGAMLATGSAINEVAQNSSAAEPFLVDFTARVAGAGRQAGISQADILGFASVMDENMLRSETSATAFQNIMVKMFQEPAKFAQIAGLNVKGFSRLVEEDANEALLRFTAALSAKGGLAELAPLFDKMKLDGQGATAVLSVMAGKIDDIRQRQQLANQAYEEGTSIVEEFNVQNNTVQAALDKARNNAEELRVELGEQLAPVAAAMNVSAAAALKVLSALLSFLTAHTAAIGRLVIVVGAYAAATALATAWTKRHAAQEAILAALQKGRLALSKTLAAATLTLRTAYYLLTGNLTRATAAMRVLNTVTKANPWGLLAAAIAAASTALWAWTSRSREAASAAREAYSLTADVKKQAARDAAAETTRIKELSRVLHDNTASLDQRRAALNAIKEIVPEYNGQLSDEGKLTRDNVDAINAYVDALERRAIVTAAQQKMTDLASRTIDLKDEKTAAQTAVDKAKAETSRVTTAPPVATGMTGIDARVITFAQAKAREEKAQQALDDLIKEEKTIERKKEELRRLIDANNYPIVVTGTKAGGGGGGGGGGGDDPDKDESRAEELRRQKEEILATQRQTEEELRARYAVGLVDYAAYRDGIVRAGRKALEQQAALYEEGTREHAAALETLADYDRKAARRRTEWSEADIDREARQKKDALAAQLLTEQQQAEQSYRIEREALECKQQLWKSVDPDKAEDYRRRIEEADRTERLRKERQFLDRVAALRKEYAQKTPREQMETELATLEEMHRRGLAGEEEYQQALRAIRLKAYDQDRDDRTARERDIDGKLGIGGSSGGGGTAAAAGDKYGFSSAITAIGTEMAARQELYAKIDRMERDGAITHEEATRAKERADKQYARRYVAVMNAAYNIVSGVMSAMSDLDQANREAELAAVERKYDAEAAAAGDNQQLLADIEQRRQAEEAEIKNKYLERAHKIELAQAIASTAMAAINAYSSAAQVPFVGYVLAPIAAAAALAAGAVQIAAIQKQHEAQAEGYYRGGFTGGTDYRREAGVVHQGEFVANHTAVANPALRPVFNLVDRAQRGNTVAAITPADVSRAVGGGGTAAAVAAFAGGNAAPGRDKRLNRTLDRLDRRLAEPVKAYVVIDGDDGLDRQYKRYKRLLDNS